MAGLLPAAPAHADRIRDQQWHLRYLKVAEANKISTGAGVTVAVIDTGVDNHPDLEGNLLPGTETFEGGIGDGRKDTDGHGTRMAGLIAAHGHGGDKGALGIAPNARILPIRMATRRDLTGSDESMGKGVEWAIANKAQVINLSWGGTGTARELQAVRAAIAADIVVVAGAGNQIGGYGGITFPAAVDGVVAVGATDQTGNRAKISVSGRQIAIVAPGVDIVSTSINGAYRNNSGTSDSTAVVSGAVALIRSKYPELSAREVVHRLTATAVDKGAPGRDPEYGYGELNLIAALTADVPPLEPSVGASAPTSPTPTASAVATPPQRRSNSTLTVIMVAVAALLAVGFVIVILLPRFRGRSGNRRPG